ncbi:MAG: thrombospondin type 3 repeat-containing protein [Candidatus Peribacteria bacterium]|nr:thrombospondin type 3 repeat-containing protein [Candidatus Peribacteria bacterium]
MYQNYSKCNFNFDYDCDGIPNIIDNCPYDWNPNQLDLDKDRIGNVCDDDIDGDGVKNAIGLVDDNNNIIISKRDASQDKTPLGTQKEGF